MLSFAPLLSVALLLTLRVSATIHPLHHLLRRSSEPDVTDVPPQCKNQCADFMSVYKQCQPSDTPVSCGCSTSAESSLIACVNCELGVAKAPMVQLAQTNVDQYVAACAVVGVILPATTVTPAAPAATTDQTPSNGTNVSNATSSAKSNIPSATPGASSTSNSTNPTDSASKTNTSTGAPSPTSTNKSSASRSETAGKLVAALAIIAAGASFLRVC